MPEFLSCIRLEQVFLTKMPKDAVLRQLFGYDPMYEDLTENICEIVLTDLIVHFCLKKPFAEDIRNKKMPSDCRKSSGIWICPG